MNIIIDWLLLRPFWVPVFTNKRRVIVTVRCGETGKSESVAMYWSPDDYIKYLGPIGEPVDR